jgi:3-phosphoglycerate kinase
MENLNLKKGASMNGLNKMTLEDIDIRDKKVLIRVDFNVPLDEKRNITDDRRIRAALPTIKYAVDKGARVILMSHLGRPKGKPADSLRMDPVAKRLGELLGKEVKKLDDCVGEEVKTEINEMKSGDVALLENLRFHPEEEKNEPNFVRDLAQLGEVYVNDAFGTAHRAHASTEGVAHHLPSVAGFLIGKEIEYLGKAVSSPQKPFVAVLGGAKVSDKIGVIDNLMDKVDSIIIGGGMAYTFLKAQGQEIGASKLEEDKIGLAGELLKTADQKGVKIYLPVDHVVADKYDASARAKTVKDIPEGWLALDIGPETVKIFKNALKGAKTIVWNGHMGVFEFEKFAGGSRELAKFVAGLDATTIIGGGDTAAMVAQLNLDEKMTHISTGGGASLEFLEGKQLPGVMALNDR